jgi:carboxylate-amine ligase
VSLTALRAPGTRVPPPALTTVGVEEEFLLVDAATGRVSRGAEPVLDALPGELLQYFRGEFHASQVETASPVCRSLSDLGRSLLALREAAARAAADLGLRPLAVGTALLPTAQRPPVSHEPRYRSMAATFGALSDTPGLCGCHVHVGVPDRERAVQVCNLLRPWLPVLQAMTANSPFYAGRDTGHASWRAVLWSRWPSAGPTPYLRNVRHYERAVRDLVASGAMLDDAMVYWYARPSVRYPTVEVRVGDVCPTVTDAVLVAGLIRALVVTLLDDLRIGTAPPHVPDRLLAAAHWRAARDGLDGDLFDVTTRTERPAWELVDRLLAKVRPALERHGDLSLVQAALSHLRTAGTGAARQRRRFAVDGDLSGVLRYVAEQTVRPFDDRSCIEPRRHDESGR